MWRAIFFGSQFHLLNTMARTVLYICVCVCFNCSFFNNSHDFCPSMLLTSFFLLTDIFHCSHKFHEIPIGSFSNCQNYQNMVKGSKLHKMTTHANPSPEKPSADFLGTRISSYLYTHFRRQQYPCTMIKILALTYETFIKARPTTELTL